MGMKDGGATNAKEWNATLLGLPERGGILPDGDTGCSLTNFESGEPGMNKRGKG